MRRLLVICLFLQCSYGVSAIDTLRLSIDSLSMIGLTQMRNAAMQSGLILKDHKKKVSAIFSFGTSDLKAKIRLKGDWLDHVDTDKWSLRIELKNGHYKGMQRFSIQHPRTRGYMTEYEIHKLLEQHGVMTTMYDFAVVFVNGENKGIYAVEEHFDFPMLDRLYHREAPILKFSEAVFWEFQRMQVRDWKPINIEYPVFENAEITSFRKKKIRNATDLEAQFIDGRNMLNALRVSDYEELSDLIDLESFAWFYAISDAIGMHHGLRWHNMRFYVDPILKKLKPIAFDCWQVKSGLNRPLLGATQERSDTIFFADIFFRDKFLNDSEFRAIYFDKLRELSENTLRNGQLYKSDKNAVKLKDQMMVEFPDAYVGGISLNPSIIINLDSVENAFLPFEHHPYREWKKNNPEIAKAHARPMPDQPIKRLGLKAFRESTEGGEQKLKVINKHISTLELVGFSSKLRVKEMVYLLEPIVDDDSAYLTISVDTCFTKIAYRVPGDTVIHKAKISRYPYFNTITNSDSLVPESASVNNGLVRLSGDVRVEKMICVNENQQLVIDAGTTITFGQNGGIICLGKFSSNGNVKNPVLIRSDSTFSGITLAGPETRFSSTQFENLELNQNQNLTGVVTVLDSELKMSDCSFTDVRSEDALNGLRVDAKISNVEFESCSSDAMDLDFSRFEIDDLRIYISGNDGLDLSGSSGTLTRGEFTLTGDKAISCGEGSQVEMNFIFVHKAQTGIAVKDGSKVKIENARLSNCDVGVWAFRKKSHYDGGEAKLKGIQFENVEIQIQNDGFSAILE